MAFFGRKNAPVGPAPRGGPVACGMGASMSDGRDKKGAAVAPLKAALTACRTGFVAMFFFSMAINLLVLASPIYMMQLYDRVLSSRSMEIGRAHV